MLEAMSSQLLPRLEACIDLSEVVSRVGAEDLVTSGDLHILMHEAAKSVACECMIAVLERGGVAYGRASMECGEWHESRVRHTSCLRESP
jgi:hypothetical protein